MNDWSNSIVQGKKYDTGIGEGKRVYEQVLSRINNRNIVTVGNNYRMIDRMAKYYESITKHRIGQGAFRVIVTDAYSRECAITGEKALPVQRENYPLKEYLEWHNDNVFKG